MEDINQHRMNDDGSITILLRDRDELCLSSLYLRDHCPCPKCRDPVTQQRLVDTFAIPDDIRPKDVQDQKNGLGIVWSPDGHQSSYKWDWLDAQRSESHFTYDLEYFDSSISKHPPMVTFEKIMSSDSGLKDWVDRIRTLGFCFVDGCPATSADTQALIERIAFIRTTHYGGFWRFTSDLASKDSAYTQLALAAHTDTTYFTDPAGLQTFHLLSHTNGEGGASLLVDGFKAAEILRHESPEDFNALCQIKIRGHSSGNEGIAIMPEHAFPVITTDEAKTGKPARIIQIRWNNDDRASMAGLSVEEINRFYRAARIWVEVLRRPESEYWVQLRPGRTLTFNNWRVLHGRSAFTGQREMCGAYTNMDDFLSRWKTLNFSTEEIMNNI